MGQQNSQTNTTGRESSIKNQTVQPQRAEVGQKSKVGAGQQNDVMQKSGMSQNRDGGTLNKFSSDDSERDLNQSDIATDGEVDSRGAREDQTKPRVDRQ